MAYDAVPAMKLSAATYRAIGEFMFRFAQLEYQLHEIVWHSLRLGYKAGRIVTIGTDSKVLVGMIGTITMSKNWVADAEIASEMNAIARTVNAYYDTRNLIAHGSWQIPVSNPRATPTLAKMKKRTQRYIPVASGSLNAAKIRTHCVDLRRANLRARRLLRRVQKALKLPYPVFA